MAKSPEPVVLDLASLPRDQMGPFLMLGLDKTADKTTIERHWADRIKWARRNQVKVALEGVNWAREVLGDVEKRIKADAASLNSDTTEGLLTQLSQRFGLQGGQASRQWQPLDSEKPLHDYVPAAEVPDVEAVREVMRDLLKEFQKLRRITGKCLPLVNSDEHRRIVRDLADHIDKKMEACRSMGA